MLTELLIFQSQEEKFIYIKISNEPAISTEQTNLIVQDVRASFQVFWYVAFCLAPSDSSPNLIMCTLAAPIAAPSSSDAPLFILFCILLVCNFVYDISRPLTATNLSGFYSELGSAI